MGRALFLSNNFFVEKWTYLLKEKNRIKSLSVSQLIKTIPLSNILPTQFYHIVPIITFTRPRNCLMHKKGHQCIFYTCICLHSSQRILRKSMTIDKSNVTFFRLQGDDEIHGLTGISRCNWLQLRLPLLSIFYKNTITFSVLYFRQLLHFHFLEASSFNKPKISFLWNIFVMHKLQVCLYL